MMRGGALILWGLTLVAAAPVSGAAPLDPAAIWEEAGAAYNEGDVAGAVAGYSDLIDRGFDQAPVWYNLGTALLRQGELGRAVAALRRAERLAPRDPDVAANLTFARESAKDAVPPPAPSEAARILLFWHYLLSPAETWWLVLGAEVVLCLALALVVLDRGGALVRAASVLLAVLLLALGTSLAVRRLAPRRVAVVLPGEVDVHSATRVDTVVRFKLHAGSEVAVREGVEGWWRIALPDGEQGWIRAEDVEVVEL